MDERAIAAHWGSGDVYSLIVAALKKMAKPLDALTVEDLAPVDHFHARGFPATVELADRLPITEPFVAAANKLTALLRMEDQVTIAHGDGQRLPYADIVFDGAYTQHVTMNVADRPGFFAEACRVLKPGAFFALTEHGLGTMGNPHYPVPWSGDGRGAYLVTPAETRAVLEGVGFEEIEVEDTGAKYVAGYRSRIEKAEKGLLPPLGPHILMGDTALQKTRNAARNIEEDRTHPILLICRKPR